MGPVIKYRIERKEPTELFRGFLPGMNEREFEHAFGAPAVWGWAIPRVYRLLASPHSGVGFPNKPSDDSHSVSLAYWSSLLQLLLYSFGWSRPDRGLRWWYDAGHPTDDPRLALIDQLWRADGQLDWFAAWLWNPHMSPDFRLSALTEYVNNGKPSDVNVDKAWLERVIRDAASSDISNPISGGSDALHLTAHCSGPLSEVALQPRLIVSAPKDRRAVLILDSMMGWYRALAEQGATLPPIGDKSWRVEVVVKPVGYLGTFRKSRQTGLWFSGRHRFHSKGV